jgi:hypothetical protein
MAFRRATIARVCMRFSEAIAQRPEGVCNERNLLTFIVSQHTLAAASLYESSR